MLMPELVSFEGLERSYLMYISLHEHVSCIMYAVSYQ
jgi:hypothetical protein